MNPRDRTPALSVTAGWAPDYPDPTDYMAPLYQPLRAYTFGVLVMGRAATAGAETLETAAAAARLAARNIVAQLAAAGGVDDAAFAHARAARLNRAGRSRRAIDAVLAGPGVAPEINCTRAPEELKCKNAEHIADKRGLYIYNFQVNSISTYASWINPAGINTNPMIGGLGDQTWYTVGYVGASP